MSEDVIDQALGRILEQIAAAAKKSGRSPESIKLLAVSKKQPIESVLHYCQSNVQLKRAILLGENYVQEYKSKREELSHFKPEVHLIGPLQSNKAKEAVRLFDVIQSVHSPEIAQLLNREAEKLQKNQRVFLQINISDDSSKSGFTPKQAEAFLSESLSQCSRLTLEGLMTITRYYENAEDARADFRCMADFSRHLTAKFPQFEMQGGVLELSMGMSADFHIAIEEGASMVRIGTALFGART